MAQPGPLGLVLTIGYSLLMAFLIAGTRRKAKARMHGRIGPPLWQPLLDFLKLLYKDLSLPSTFSTIFFLAPVVGAIVGIVASLIVPLPGIQTLSFSGDIAALVILVSAIDFMLLTGGVSSGNPYSWVSFSRAAMLAIIREVFVAASFAALVVKAQETSLIKAIAAVPLHFKASLGIFFLVCSLGVSLTTVFSAPLAETEILEGFLIEYSGPLLALAELTHMLQTYIVLSLSSTLIASALSTGATGIIVHILLLLAFSLLTSFLDSAFARLRIGAAVKIYALLLAICTLCVYASLMLG
ncbi:MAG: NADH-quinone oxidoreductase subunit H [Thermofilum sp.]|nr:NADH-quinone oxidoreductase subunit H [Thermofilum sp.]